MKLTALVGTNADASYSSKLLSYIQTHFSGLATITVCEISGLPLFSTEESVVPSKIQQIADLMANSDGVIITTPEFNHTIPAALSSVLSWLSWQLHPLKQKPVLMIGVSPDSDGVTDALEDLKQILQSANIDAQLLSDNQFTLYNAQENLTDTDIDDPFAFNRLEKNFKRFTDAVANGFPAADATSGASQHPDATSGASQKSAEVPDYSSDRDQPKQTDATSGASQHPDTTSGASQKSAEVPDYSSDRDQPKQTDATSGASQHPDATSGASQKSTEVPDYSSDRDQPKQTDAVSGASAHH
ncbi:putative flavoprotein [Secundilactobacillus pentosiphilus]|uniref:Flavoprotein n=1 Tax=Secundilactobacillus pentosiphilus TaxID=1714682 RepID=A0A1Z5IP36_9LACO|nr:NAD(P)H-dependent oxidoreductase [Secundilactobacillus pentosiphilus]GAX03505.1 putative flavoprotein [Secundilactobacillus pentosiphilus]